MCSTSKICRKCGITFNKRYCHNCANIRAKKYRLEHPEKVKATKAAHYAKNKESVSKKQAQYYLDNSEKVKARVAEYRINNIDAYKEMHKKLYAANKDKYKQKAKEWKANNPDRVLELNRAWAAANPDKVAKSRRAYSQNNKHKLLVYQRNRKKNKPWLSAYYSAKYEECVIERTPNWVDYSRIADIYAKCPIGFEVDHIIPLRGKLVSGLNVPNNLQYLPMSVNRRKLNKFWPDSFDTAYHPDENLIGRWKDDVTGFEYLGEAIAILEQ